MRSLREEYIKELFHFKNKFAKETEGNKANAETKNMAYLKLVEMVKDYISKMVRLEKNKYMRERIFYQNEG